MNLVDGIMEGYPKTKQKLIEDSEIETDEAAGFDINQYKWTVLNSLALRQLALTVWSQLEVANGSEKLALLSQTELVPFDEVA